MSLAPVIVDALARSWSLRPAEIEIERVTGGLVNEVYRLRGGDRSVIVKHALPYVAAAPQIPLSPRRSAIEARCLRELGPGGRLQPIVTSHVRAPHLIAEFPELSVNVIEDLGSLPDLGTAARIDPILGRELGGFLARLHVASRSLPEVLDEVENRDVQDTRYRTQYTQVGSWLADYGRRDHAALGASAVDVGRRFRARGPSLIMGDLWLPSLLVDGDALRVIDWEFAHAGSPAQDLGHVLAHLWMHEHRAGPERADRYRELRRELVGGYASGSGLATPDLVADACRHAGCEVLARVLGPFRSASLYASPRADEPAVMYAIDVACAALLGDDGLWSA